MQSVKLSVFVLLALGLGTACERVVLPGETLTLAMGESLVGAPGDDQTPGRPAVTVQSGGRLDVVAADLRGGAALTNQVPGNARPGQGIFASGGQVNVAGGTVQGGSVVVLGEPGPFRGGNGAEVARGLLTIRGGQLRGGDAPPPGQPGDGVQATESNVLIFGGDIDSLSLSASNAFVFGGRIGRLSIATIFNFDALLSFTPFPSEVVFRPSCLDLSGGQIQGPIVITLGNLFITGSSFNLPFGPVPAPPDLATVQQIRLTGVLADGSPIDVEIQRRGGALQLVPVQVPAPGEPLPVDANLFCPFGVPS